MQSEEEEVSDDEEQENIKKMKEKVQRMHVYKLIILQIVSIYV